MTMKQFDEYTKMEDFQGKDYSELTYELRVELYHKLTPEDRKAFQLGRATPEIINQAQTIYDEHWEKMNPTDSTIYQRQEEARKRSDIDNIDRTLKRSEQRLKQLDELKRLDGELPIGAREILRNEIKQLKGQLQTLKGLDGNVEGTPTDWVDNFFSD